MRFGALLIHRCTLIHQGQKIGEDEYGQDIFGDLVEANVPCRVDKVQQFVSPDNSGEDYIQENTLFISKQIKVSLSMRIRDIIDKEGNPVLPGDFRIKLVNPMFGKRKLNHFEISIRKE